MKNRDVVFEGTTKECVSFICNHQESALSLILVHDRKEKNYQQLKHEKKVFGEVT